MLKSVLKKPIIVIGLALSALLWGWESLQGNDQQWSQWSLWGLSSLGLLLWYRQRRRAQPVQTTTAPLTPELLQTAIAQTEKVLTKRQAQAPTLELEDLRSALAQLSLPAPLPTVLDGIVLGEKRSGKTSLLALLPSQLRWGQTSENLVLNWQVLNGETSPEELTEALVNAHWVLFLTTGDLTQSQWQTVQLLHNQRHHWQLLFNKQDLHTEGDRQLLLEQLQTQVQSLGGVNPVLPISTAPQPLQIRRHLADGTVETELEQSPPQLGDLLEQLQQQANQQRETMQLARQWRQCQAIERQIQQRWQANRRQVALPVVEQAQWLAAGTALINPVANLDLLTAIAINGQMVWDLSGLYGQQISLDQAKTVATEMGTILIKLGMVELSTQALGALLKSQPLTYLAGGALQGLSAAYLTRIAGLSLITFLEKQEADLRTAPWNWQQLTGIVQRTFEQNQRLTVLQGFVNNAAQQLPKLTNGPAVASAN